MIRRLFTNKFSKRLLAFSVIMCVLSIAAYGYMVSSMVATAAAKERYSSSNADIHTDVANLEQKLVVLQTGISDTQLADFGLEVTTNKTIVTSAHLGLLSTSGSGNNRP